MLWVDAGWGVARVPDFEAVGYLPSVYEPELEKRAHVAPERIVSDSEHKKAPGSPRGMMILSTSPKATSIPRPLNR